ncbi:M23 family metallopeptidase [Microbacterium lacus]|uniref:M23ase beta-sheet core domain-containing protein n=1 Tax=Microbacterium lacus TaxID=415217 RepID=A0ABN2FY13_9MICO
MGAPVAATAALVKTRTGRKIATGALAFVLLINALILTPLIAIPLAVAGSATANAVSSPAGGGPVVSGEWGYPLSGDFSKGRGYGYNPVEGCGFCSTDHKGYDMAQGCGATIYAVGPGTVLTAGAYQGYGNTVRIDHGNNLTSLYGHMEWGSLRVAEGQSVTAGTPIGAEGNTGNSFGCHLHFELRDSGTPIDPQPFMAARGLPLK